RITGGGGRAPRPPDARPGRLPPGAVRGRPGTPAGAPAIALPAVHARPGLRDRRGRRHRRGPARRRRRGRGHQRPPRRGKPASDRHREGGGAMTDSEHSTENLTYEQARAELVATVERLEAGGATLEESLRLWERGEALADLCQSHLEGARKRLEARTAAE